MRRSHLAAAQAIVAGRRLITINGRDFSSISTLDLEVWPAVAARTDLM